MILLMHLLLQSYSGSPGTHGCKLITSNFFELCYILSVFSLIVVETLQPPNMATQSPALPQSFAPDTSSFLSNQTAFNSLDSNVPGLSQVILDKLNMKDYGEYRYNIGSDQSWHSKLTTTPFRTNPLEHLLRAGQSENLPQIQPVKSPFHDRPIGKPLRGPTNPKIFSN